MKKPEFVTNHVMPRECELILGFLLAIIGIWLIWLAYQYPGAKMWWPLSGLMPV